MIELLLFGAACGGIVVGYNHVRRFVRDRLRFVDAVQRPSAPLLAGAAGLVAAAPVVWVLPFIGGGVAILFGAGMGLAVKHGARDVRDHHRSIPGGF